MTDKIQKDHNLDESEEKDILQDDAKDVNAKGGQTTDEGLDQYGVSYFEANEMVVDDEDEEDAWGESASKKTESSDTDEIA